MAYQQLPPVAFAQLSGPARDSLEEITSLTIFNLDTQQPEMRLYDRWAPILLAFGQPNAGDALVWDPVLGYYVPSPTSTPILRKLAVYGDSTDTLEVKRFHSGLTKTGTGTGTMLPTGDHTLAGSTNKSYRVQIDTAGVWQDATFKWSDDGGVTFQASTVPIAYGTTTKTIAPIPLADGVTVTFTPGTYVLDDRWDFEAIAADNQRYTFKVSTSESNVYVNDELIVASDDAGDSRTTIRSATLGGLPSSFIYMGGAGASLPGSYVRYDTTLGLEWYDAGLKFRIDADDPVGGTGGMYLYDLPLNLSEISTPSTPAANNGKLYAKDVSSVSRPFWLDDAGIEQAMLTAAMHGATGDPHAQYAAVAGDTFTGDLTVSGVFVVNNTAVFAGAVGFAQLLHTGTADGADTGVLDLSGGGSVAGDTRGARVFIAGNERAGSLGGVLRLIAGNVSTGHIQMYTGAAALRYELTDDAKMGWFAATPVVKQTSGANLTNSVTAGGTDDTITNWTSLATYSTDAAAIRNAVYQLARKLKQINDGIRAYGLFT